MIVYCRCTCRRHTLVSRIRKVWPIGTREIDELPKASMAELLVAKQDQDTCVGWGKMPTNLEAMSLNY